MAGLPESQPIAHSTYEALLEFLYLTPVGIIRFRPDGTIDMANPVATQLLMPLAGDANLSNLYTLLSAVAPDLRASICRFKAPAGQICDQMQLVLSGAVLALTINKIDANTLMAVMQDITRVIEQEIRILDDQQRFRAIFENIRDYAIYTVNLDGRVEAWNRTLSRLGGWEPADVTGAPIDLFFPPAQTGQPQGAALLIHARKHGSAETEGWGVHKDGSLFWGDTVVTVLPDPEGRTVGYVVITRERRRQGSDGQG